MSKSLELKPKQSAFLRNYLDIDSPTFGNAMQSAIAAGYEKTYAQNILGEDSLWLNKALSDQEMLQKVDRNINTLLDQDKDLRVKNDMTKFIAERLNRKKYGQTKNVDITTNGEPITGIQYIIPE